MPELTYSGAAALALLVLASMLPVLIVGVAIVIAHFLIGQAGAVRHARGSGGTGGDGVRTAHVNRAGGE